MASALCGVFIITIIIIVVVVIIIFQFISILSTVNKCSLSIRRFWGKGERWKRKRENLLSPSPLGRPDTQARINA